MAGLVAEKGGNWLESSSRKAFLRGSFSPCERPKVEWVRVWGGPCDKSTRAFWCGHKGVVVRSRGRCGEVTRALWWGHKGVVVRSWGRCGEVTRVLWCRHEGVMNHLWKSAEWWADTYDSSVLCTSSAVFAIMGGRVTDDEGLVTGWREPRDNCSLLIGFWHTKVLTRKKREQRPFGQLLMPFTLFVFTLSDCPMLLSLFCCFVFITVR